LLVRIFDNYNMSIEKISLLKTKSDPMYNISIIVPVYNAEATIQRTLQSLIDQTLPDIEIICIDDGSTDSSLKIMTFMQSKYPKRINILTGLNQGVYKARARGIEAARGRFIAFCDSDDTVEPSMYETLFSKAEETDADLTVCAYWRQEKNKILSTEMQHSELTQCNIDPESGWFVSVNTAVWNKLFKANIAQHYIEFQQPPRITEDALFLFSLCPYIGTIAFVDKPLYHYYINNSTAMKTISLKDAIVIRNAWKELRFAFQKKHAKYIPIIDLAAFIHLGLSLPLIMVKTHNASLKNYLRDIRKSLDKDFTTFKDSRFLKLSYVFKHHVWMTLPFLASVLYKMRLICPALKTYDFLTTIFRKDLKW